MAFESPNYTQAPNDLFDVMLESMGYAELKVTLIAIRKSLGFHQDSFRLSVTKMAELTGLSRVSVLEGAEQAEKRGTLTRINDGGVIEWTVNLLNSDVNLLNNDCKGSIPPSNKERTKEKKKQNAAKPREHDLLFDAIIEVTGIDPKTAGSSVAKVCEALKKSDPPYTPDEVRAYGVDWWSWKERTKPPTIWKLKEEIGLVRSNGNKKHSSDESIKGRKVYQ